MRPALTYTTDEPGYGHTNTLLVARDEGGDFLVGVKHVAGQINHGTNFVRFRRANGGASQHPRLIAALAELEAALRDIGNA